MNTRTTIVLLVLLAAIGAAWWFTRGLGDNLATNTQVDNEPTPVIPAGTLEPHRVERIEIEHSGKTLVVLEQQRGRWRMTYPYAFDADAKTINQLITTLSALADRGDGPPSASDSLNTVAQLTFHTADTQHHIRLDPRIGGGLGSIRFDGQAPRLVDDALHAFFERYDPTDLLSKQLAAPTAYGTDRFTVTTPHSTARLVREGDRWYIDGDPQQPALTEPVDGFIDVGGYLNIPIATTIERFVIQPADDLATYGLAQPRVRIDYETPSSGDEPARSTLLIGSPTDASGNSYFATYYRAGNAKHVVFVLSHEFSIVLAKSADDFRDPRLYKTLPQEIERIEVRGEENWALRLTDERGSLIAPSRSISGDSALLRERVTALVTATAQGYMDPDEVDFDPYPPVTIEVIPTLGRPAERVTFYYWDRTPQLENEDGVFHVIALREGESKGMLIPWGAFEQLGDLSMKEELVEPDSDS